MSRRELLLVCVALAAGIGVLPFVGGAELWTHPLWTDEWCCTVYPTQNAASPVQVIRNIAAPQDYAPPLLHVIVWTVGTLTGGVTPIVLRTIAVVSVALALLFAYATLRHRFGAAASTVGVLAVAAHPLVLTHAFEGRFYGPWLFFAALYGWSLSSRRALVQAIAAIALVTIHWYGVLSLGLMIVAGAAAHGKHWRGGLRAVTPSATGIVALLACVPMALTQRSGSGDFLWLPPISAAEFLGLARVFFLTAIPALAATLVVTQLAWIERPQPILVATKSAVRDPGILALFSLAAMPLALVFVSVVLQPALLGRYAIVTALFMAPLVALALDRLALSAKLMGILVVAVPLVQNVRTAMTNRRAFAIGVAAEVAAYEQAKAMQVPIAIPGFHTIYPILGGHRFEPTPARFLDIPDSTLVALYPSERIAWLRRRMRIEINNGRSHSKVYGFPQVITTAELDTARRFVVLASDLRVPGGLKQAENWGKIVFPRHRVTRLNDQLSLFELSAAQRPRR